MKKILLPIFALSLLFSSNVFADTKPKTPPAIVKKVEEKKEKYYKFEWFVKKTGKVVVTRSTVIHASDPENAAKTGKIVFSPQRIPVGDSSYLLGLGIDMKLFENKGAPIIGMVGIYTDPNPIYDFTEKMPDEQNVAHAIIQPETSKFTTGQSVTLTNAKFVKAYDLSKPNGQEITFTRFIIKEPTEASLIEITFKVYEFEVSDKDKVQE